MLVSSKPSSLSTPTAEARLLTARIKEAIRVDGLNLSPQYWADVIHLHITCQMRELIASIKGDWVTVQLSVFGGCEINVSSEVPHKVFPIAVAD